MPNYDITPALYSITRKISRPIIESRWDTLIVPVLRNEQRMHVHAFSAFALTQSISQNSACGLEIFVTILRHEGLDFEYEDIPNAVFDVYWDLAEDKAYWLSGHYAEIGQELPYETTLRRWESDNRERAQWCEERLRQWLNGD